MCWTISTSCSRIFNVLNNCGLVVTQLQRVKYTRPTKPSRPNTPDPPRQPDPGDPKTRPTRIHRPMNSMTFETGEILHFGDIYQAKRPFLEFHRTDESDEIDEIWYRPKDSQNFKEFQQNFKKISKIQKTSFLLKNDVLSHPSSPYR